MSASGSSGRSDGSWTSGASGAAGRGDGVDRGQLLEVDPRPAAAASSAASRVSAATARHRVAVVLGLADREHRPVPQLGAEARHRVREVGGGHDEPDAGHGHGRARVDPADPRPRHVERDELHVEDVVEVDVGDVLLLPGDPLDPADARRRLADASLRREPPRRASTIGRRSCGRSGARRGLRAPPRRRPARPRRSARSRRTGSSCRRGPPRPRRGSGAGRRSSRACAATSWPGMQNPHWTPPTCRGTPAGAGSARRRTASPSTVVIRAPSVSAASTRHASTLRSVDQDRAGAALADQAALLGPGQAEVVARSTSSSV